MSQAQGYTVSRELLARADFCAACAERDFAVVFRLMSKYDGASQDRICSPVEGLSQSRVSKIMRGDDHIAAMQIIERIADGLRIPGHYLGLAARDWETLLTPVEVPAIVESAAVAALPEAVSSDRVVHTLHTMPERAPAIALRAAPSPALQDFPARPVAPTQRPVGLRPHIERAFEQESVTIDFAGFSGETLAGALSEPLDKVRSGELTPSTIRVRVLVPDTGRPWSFPCRIEDLSDEPAFRHRAAGIVDRSLSAILDSITELQDLGAVTDAVAEVRVHGLSPQFKLYLINGSEAFFGFYPVTEHTVRAGGAIHAMYDVMGKDSMLFHHHDDGVHDSAGTQYLTQARTWFDSVWVSLSTAYHRG